MPRANGYMLIVDPAAPCAVEADTATCSHCQRVVRLNNADGTRRASVVVHCHGCDAHVCVPCAETGRCEPFEKQLEILEARGRLLAAAGL